MGNFTRTWNRKTLAVEGLVYVTLPKHHINQRKHTHALVLVCVLQCILMPAPQTVYDFTGKDTAKMPFCGSDGKLPGDPAWNRRKYWFVRAPPLRFTKPHKNHCVYTHTQYVHIWQLPLTTSKQSEVTTIELEKIAINHWSLFFTLDSCPGPTSAVRVIRLVYEGEYLEWKWAKNALFTPAKSHALNFLQRWWDSLWDCGNW